MCSLLLLACLLPVHAGAQPVAVCDLAVLVDETGTETIASVSAPQADQRFVPLAGTFNAGYTRKVHWLRFTVPATSSPWWLEAEPSYLDDLRLFEPVAQGFVEQRAGDRLAFSSRGTNHHGFIFKLSQANPVRTTYFLRVQTTSSSLATLKLWQAQTFNTAVSAEYLNMGVFYGVMLSVLLSNIVIWLVLRKKIFGWFALFLFACTASNLANDGLIAQYFLTSTPLLADGFVGFTTLFVLSANAPFFWHVVGLRREQRFFHNVYRVQLVLPWLLMPSVFLDLYPEAMQIGLTYTLLASLIPLTQAIRNWQPDEPDKLFVVLGTCLLVLGGMNSALILMGLLPSAASTYCEQQAAYILVVLIFQIALAMRLQRLDGEHQELEARHSRLHEEQQVKDSQSHSVMMDMLSQKITLLEDMEQKKVELEKSDLLWRFAIEGGGDGVWDSNLQTGEVTFSDRWLEMLGYDRADMAASLQSWENLLHPEDELRVLKAARAYTTGEADHYRIEFRMRCKDGSYKSILSRGMFVSYSSDGKPLRMVGAHTDLTPLRQAEAHIHQLSYYDPHTKLPNIHLFEAALSRELSASTSGRLYGAVLFVRFADFKLLSDTRGQRCSELLAGQIAQRLGATVRSEDTVARRDTYDFAIIAPRLDVHRNNALARATQMDLRLRKLMGTPFEIDGEQHHCLIKVGISLFRYTDKLDEVSARAGLALAQAMTERLNEPCFFRPEMAAMMEKTRALEGDLRHAIEHNQFELYYQPQVHATQQVVGAEALLRWQHPRRGLTEPNLFIGIAEQSDLILPIGMWVLKAACEQLTSWSADPHLRTLQIAINVSSRHFQQPGFVTQVQQVLARTGAPPHLLKFELTESLMRTDIPGAIEKIRKIKQLGIQFAVDDFDAGSSSLTYLEHLPIDQIKIDKAFVQKIPDDGPADAITQSIIAMAQGLRMDVIAEGVETQAQRATLESQGCYVYQGYLFSRPLQLAQFKEFVYAATSPKKTTLSAHSSSPAHSH